MTRPSVTVFTVVTDSPPADAVVEALLGQTFAGWEWVVALGSDNDWKPAVPDPRIRVVLEPQALSDPSFKRLACHIALGSILLEMRDDLLTPDALAKIVDAFEAHPGHGVVYADRVGQPMLPPYPANFAHVDRLPSGLVAFRRDAYEAVKGYDVEAGSWYAEDLLSRLYQHTGFVHLAEPLSDRASREAPPAAETAVGGEAFYDMHVENNCLAWARRTGLLAVNLGPPRSASPDYLVADRRAGEDVDLVIGPDGRIGLNDSSVGVIRAYDHLPYYRDKVALFDELHRVLAPGGVLLTYTPSTDGRGAFQDPTHVSFYNQNTFRYFERQFEASRLATFFPSPWHEGHRISYVRADLVAVET